MSRAARKQLLGTMEALQKANRMVSKTIKSTQQDGVHELLVECQECAIAIGNQIEQLYGEGTQSVSGLEAYCEMIYQMTQHMGDIASCKELCELAEKLLEGIKADMEREIPDRTEAVFLPYKASMWDSLESVWKAADEDPDCVAYVIPIPYYEKNPDGSFREEHYEGELYPDYVPITRYDEYDFGMHKPDMIFIHNPYDDANFVTSVHPFFYAKNLKQFTDKLVYIPYFVLGEFSSRNRDAVKTMRHFCMTPGVIHAHRVIVQSEEMRQIYINVMTEAAGENTRNYWEEKILGLGSPKIDKACSTGKEGLEIPEEWLQIVQKPDGTRKKVVFYNTGVSALLQFNEQLLVKMKDVLRIFKEHKDEVTLLWRPHPLIQSTLETMRPQLWTEYKNMVEEYRQQGWGIYDDSSDMNRAVALSDAYYGDGSSLSTLFLEMGRDMMLQNPDVIYDKVIQDYVWSYDFVLDGLRIWFVPFWYNKLCCYNLSTESMEDVIDIPEKNHYCGLYSNIIKIRQWLILLPTNAAKACIYDTDTFEWKTYEIEDSDGFPELFLTYGVWEDVVFLFPQTYPKIVKVNLKLRTMEYADSYEYADLQFQAESCTVGSKVYLLIKDSNQVMIYDMKTEKAIIREIGDSKEQYFTICHVEKDTFVLSNCNGDVVVWNEATGELQKCPNLLKGFAVDEQAKWRGAFNHSLIMQKSVYFFPDAGNKVAKVNIADIKNSVLEQEGIFGDCVHNKIILFSGYSRPKKQDEYLYVFDVMKKRFLVVNTETHKKYIYKIALTPSTELQNATWYKEFGTNLHTGHLEYDTSYLQLFNFLENLDVSSSDCSRFGDTIGIRIYKAVKSIIHRP